MAGRTRIFFLTDGFPDGIYDVADVSVGFAMERGLQSAAAVWPRMTRGAFSMGYGILDGAELVGVDHISSDADGEKLAKTTGEDDFGDDAGVRTGDDHSAGRLPAGQGETFLREMSPAKAPLFTYAAFPSLSVCKTISDVCTAASLSLTTCLYTTPFYPACKGSGRTSRAKKGIKKHPEKASHLYPMQAELGIGDGRPWAPKCGRTCAIVGTGLAEDREVEKPCFRIFIFSCLSA